MPAITLAAAGSPAGQPVTRLDLSLPQIGAWTADLRVGARALTTGRVDLRIGDRLTLVGTVARARIHEGLLRVWVVGGADGLRRQVRPKHHTSPTLAVVLRGLLADVGETLAPSADAAVLGTQLEHWTTMAMPAGQAIRCLLPLAGADIAWRLLPDGALWVGRERWPTSSPAGVAAIGAVPEEATVQVVVVDSLVLPGTVWEGRRVGAAHYAADGGGATGTLWTET